MIFQLKKNVALSPIYGPGSIPDTSCKLQVVVNEYGPYILHIEGMVELEGT
jgi:hypothetical protein